MVKKLMSLFLFMVLILSLTACGGDNSTNASVTGNPDSNEETTNDAVSAGVLPTADNSRKTTANTNEKYEKITIGVSTDPQNLLPFNPNVASKPYMYYCFYETLFDLENGEYIPVLAKSYEVIDDLHYEVEIYDYIYDSEGNHITADDIVYCYDLILESGYALKYASFESIEKVSDYKVKFTWTKAITEVSELEFPWCRTFIFSKEAYENNNFETAPIATGVYTVDSFVSGSSLVLKINENYWQTDESLITQRHQANVKTIQYDIIIESSQQVIALQTGTIDFSQFIPSENLVDFQEGGQYSGNYTVWTGVGGNMYNMAANTSSSSLLSDENLRLAVFYAIDNASCAKVSGNSEAAKAFGSPFYSDYVDSWSDTPSYINTYDAELAKEYLEKSYYNGETLVLMGGNDETAKNLLTIIQSFLINVGINTEIKMVETATIGNYATDPTAWDLQVDILAGGSLIGTWNRVMNNEEFSNNMAMGFIDDPKLQELYKKANTVETYGDESMTELHDYCIENAYYYSLILPYQNLVYSNDIAEIYLREGNYILPGAFTYYLD